MNLKLPADVTPVGHYGINRDKQLLRDFLVGQAFHDTDNYLTLPVAQPAHIGILRRSGFFLCRLFGFGLT